MFIFHILYITAIVGGVTAYIPLEKMNISVFGEISIPFETRITESLKTTQKFFAREEVKVSTDVAAVLLSAEPDVGFLAGLLPIVRDLLAYESDWRTSFANAINDEAKRLIVKNEIDKIVAALTTCEKYIDLMVNRSDVVTNLHMKFDEIINLLNTQDTFLLEHPLLTLPVLMTLSSIIAVYQPIQHSRDPELTNISHLSCAMKTVLLKYRPRAIHARLMRTNVDNYETRPILYDVLQSAYNGETYVKEYLFVGEVDCRRNFQEHDFKIRDKVSNEEFFSDERTLNSCVRSYMVALRFQVERLFPIDIISLTCPEEKHQVLWRKTGNIICLNVDFFTK